LGSLETGHKKTPLGDRIPERKVRAAIPCDVGVVTGAISGSLVASVAVDRCISFTSKKRARISQYLQVIENTKLKRMIK
jgi:hypothetical protein